MYLSIYLIRSLLTEQLSSTSHITDHLRDEYCNDTDNHTQQPQEKYTETKPTTKETVILKQGLKYNCQCGETVQLFEPPVHFLAPCFNSGLSNYQRSTECIKHDFMLFFKFCNSIQLYEFMIVKT